MVTISSSDENRSNHSTHNTNSEEDNMSSTTLNKKRFIKKILTIVLICTIVLIIILSILIFKNKNSTPNTTIIDQPPTQPPVVKTPHELLKHITPVLSNDIHDIKSEEEKDDITLIDKDNYIIKRLQLELNNIKKEELDILTKEMNNKKIINISRLTIKHTDKSDNTTSELLNSILNMFNFNLYCYLIFDSIAFDNIDTLKCLVDKKIGCLYLRNNTKFIKQDNSTLDKDQLSKLKFDRLIFESIKDINTINVILSNTIDINELILYKLDITNLEILKSCNNNLKDSIKNIRLSELTNLTDITGLSNIKNLNNLTLDTININNLYDNGYTIIKAFVGDANLNILNNLKKLSFNIDNYNENISDKIRNIIFKNDKIVYFIKYSTVDKFINRYKYHILYRIKDNKYVGQHNAHIDTRYPNNTNLDKYYSNITLLNMNISDKEKDENEFIMYIRNAYLSEDIKLPFNALLSLFRENKKINNPNDIDNQDINNTLDILKGYKTLNIIFNEKSIIKLDDYDIDRLTKEFNDLISRLNIDNINITAYKDKTFLISDELITQFNEHYKSNTEYTIEMSNKKISYSKKKK